MEDDWDIQTEEERFAPKFADGLPELCFSMEPKKNLCAQIPVSLHTRIRQEQEESGKSLSEFMTELLTNYYENGGNRKMDGKQRTVAFQVPEELFEQFKEYLKQHNMKQNAFFLDCIRQALEHEQES